MEGVYLLHFAEPYRHARHYLGWSQDIDARYVQHVTGHGSALVAAVRRKGIDVSIVARWEGRGRTFESYLKRQHKNIARLCPLCRERALEQARIGMRRSRARRKARAAYLLACAAQRTAFPKL